MEKKPNSYKKVTVIYCGGKYILQYLDRKAELTESQMDKVFRLARRQLRTAAKGRTQQNITAHKEYVKHLGAVYGPIYREISKLKIIAK